MNYDLTLIRYGELSLKSKYVRNSFESTLVRNVKEAFLSNNMPCKIEKEWGRIYLSTDEISKGLDVLKRIFGITSFSPAVKTSSEIDQISSYALEISKNHLDRNKTFALRVTRTGKHDYTSQDVAVKIGNDIVKATQANVNLTKPDFELFIEVRNKNSYLFTEKIRGVGGLPLGTQGKILAIIDKPYSLLAAWYLMRRGCKAIFLNADSSNVEMLNTFMDKWYAKSDIIAIDQKEKFYETANNTASENGCDAIVTGHNIITKNDIIDITAFKKHAIFPVLHPLIAMNEDEINKKSKEMGIPT